MRTPCRRLFVNALALLVSGMASAQPPGPCTVAPFFDFDGTAENVLGIAPGFVGEYCQQLDLTPVVTGANAALCTNNGSYFVSDTFHGTTRNGGTAHPVFGDVRLRRVLADPLDFDAIVTGVPDLPLGIPPQFPAYDEQEIAPYDPDLANALLEEAGWVMNDDGIRVCRGWNGDDSTQALPADVGPGPVHDIHATFNGGGLWERVQNFPGFEQYRSVQMGVEVAPIGGTLTGSQVVPPSPTTARGSVRMWRHIENLYRIRANHDLPNPFTAGLYRGLPGVNGSLLLDLGSGASPVDVLYTPPDPAQFEQDLAAGKLYTSFQDTSVSHALRANLALAEQRISEFDLYNLRVGLTRPGSSSCEYVHYLAPSEGLVQFDYVAESPFSFTNGTVVEVDEIESPRGGPFFNFQLGMSVDAGPPELFPAGYFEPGTGIPLTDGCIDLGQVDPLDFSSFAAISRATLQTFIGSTPAAPPDDVTLVLPIMHRLANRWLVESRFELPVAAGQGIDGVRLEVQMSDGIFGDPFYYPNTDAWDITIGGPP